MILKRNHVINDSITIHSRGGLGNQLFIFGAGLALADQLKCQLYLDSSQHQFVERPFLLNKLIPSFSTELQERICVTPSPSNILRRHLLKKSIPGCCSYNEPSFTFDPNFFALHTNTCVFGYFQSWKYLNKLSLNRVSEIQSAIHQLGSSDYNFESNDIVLHFRRGDYLNPDVTEIHGVLGFDYYSRSISRLREHGFSGNIWFVSESKIEDIQPLEDTLGREVRQISGLSIWQDLSLLMKAPSLVTANSTFSWMGGWFGPVIRPIVAPYPWFKSEDHDTSDLIPPNWHTISHDF